MRVYVVVAEADPLICEGLAESLSEEPYLAGYPSINSVEKALDRCRELQGAVLLLSEPYLEGLDLAHFMEQIDWGRAVPVLVLGAVPSADKLMRCLRLGCVGYVHRRESLATLRKAIYAAAGGQIWAPRAALTAMLRQLIDSHEQAPRLTNREREILALIGEGCRNADISNRLYISPETVRWHARRLMGKIGVHDRAEAVEYARRTMFPVRRPAASLPPPLPAQSTSSWRQRQPTEISGRM